MATLHQGAGRLGAPFLRRVKSCGAHHGMQRQRDSKSVLFLLKGIGARHLKKEEGELDNLKF